MSARSIQGRRIGRRWDTDHHTNFGDGDLGDGDGDTGDGDPRDGDAGGNGNGDHGAGREDWEEVGYSPWSCFW